MDEVFEYGKVYKIDIIKLAKNRMRCKFDCIDESDNYKDYLNLYSNEWDAMIFEQYNIFMYKGKPNRDILQIQTKLGTLTMNRDAFSEVK